MTRGRGRGGPNFARRSADGPLDRARQNQDQTPPGKGQRNIPEKPRDRSPVERVDDIPNQSENVEDTASAPSGESFKHCGRPGEKKFNGRCRLFVANLPRETQEKELKEIFSAFGDIGETFVNKEKGFGFIRMDYRLNAEMAKLSMDKKLVKGRNIKVCYATHAAAVELHGLDNFASNEFIGNAMSVFGAVERCKIVCDDRGKSKGYAIVEFEWKKSAAKVLDRLKDEMFVLGRLPKPVFAKPHVLTDMEEGILDETLERMDGYQVERSFQPRFIHPDSFEYTWAKRWRDLFIEEQDRKAKLEQEKIDARCKLEFEMEAAIRQNQASMMREELERKQEQLRMLAEDMMKRQEDDMRILERSRQREMAGASGNPEQPPATQEEIRNNEIALGRENAARQADFHRLRERANMVMNEDSMMGGNRFGNQPQPLFGRNGPQFSGMDYHRGGDMQRDHRGGDMQRGMQQQRGMNQRDMRGPPRDMPPPRDVSARELANEGPNNGPTDPSPKKD